MEKIRVFFNDKQDFIKITNKIKNILEFCCILVLKLEKFKYSAEISILFTNNEEIKKLNFKYKNKNIETDVLSFPTKIFGSYFKYNINVVVLGDIVISTQKALSQLKEFESYSIEQELARLTIHSILHLLGYDHEKNDAFAILMQKKEKILNKIVSNKFKFERDSGYEE